MSYILDALKKSEQERGHGNIPDVQTVHSSSLNYRSDKKSYWPYILTAAVILNLLAIIYFNHDKNSTEKKATAATETIPEAEPQDITRPAVIVPVMKQRVMDNPVIISKQPDGHSDKSAANSATKKTDSTQEGTAGKEKRIEETGSTPVDTQPIDTQLNPPENTSTAKSDSEIIEFYDLPDSISSQLPAIIISAHIYSTNPSQRSIVINNKYLEEGDYIIDDIILYEITGDGAIFLYDGILFHHGVVSSWQ
ncbi:MAG: general secretion pathway protein GspB [Proteobacteria bacterium]|nr:general secretion pathway protein GspB [Pseudomonadota bacterium]